LPEARLPARRPPPAEPLRLWPKSSRAAPLGAVDDQLDRRLLRRVPPVLPDGSDELSAPGRALADLLGPRGDL